MNRFSSWRRAVIAFLLIGADPALADNASDLDARAAAEYNRGLDARDAGQNGAACRYFRNSAVLYENSIYALTSRYMGSEEARATIRTAADQQQSQANGAKARAAEVCGKADGPALTSSSGSYPVSDDYFAEKKELQRTSDLAHSQYKESVRLWEAGNRTGACAASRQSVAYFEKVSSAMKGNPALRGAFGNPEQVLTNAKVAIEDRDGMFCAGAGGKKEELIKTAALASDQYDEAMRLWDAGNRPGACAAMRLSAANYGKAASAMTADPALKETFNGPETIFENAEQAAKIRDTMFCKA